MAMRTPWRVLAGLALAGVIAACNSPQPPPPKALGSTPPPAFSGPCTGVSLAASRQSPVVAGTQVVFVATARGCTDPQFRFVVSDASATSGSVARDWDFVANWSWTTYATPAGHYIIRADAREGGTAPPDASAYLAFVVTPGAPASAATCRLPVSGLLAGSGGFIQMPAGAFTADPTSQVSMNGQPDISGLRRGLTYDPVHGDWLPVPRDWVMPDFSSYVYVGTEHPNVSNQPALHLVKLPSGVDTIWPNGDQLYGLPIALRPEGVYGAPGPEIITVVDPAGATSTVDQGHNGLFAVVTPTAIWATKVDTTSSGQYAMTDVQRIDLKSHSAADWFVHPGATVFPIGVDADGNPIVAAGTQQPDARIAATQVWSVPQASHGQLIYSDAAHPLTIVGWPILSAGAVWIETDKGLWVEDSPGSQMRLVSSYSAYIAGGCL